MKNEEGIKFDSDKLRWDLIPFACIEELAKVYTFGAKKYGDNNWQKVTPKSRYVAAMLRHFCAWQGGESRDPETGLFHLSHMVWNGIALLWFEVRGE